MGTRTRTTNTFIKGMSQDIDKHIQDNQSYRYALNGRIIYNTSNKDIETKGGVLLGNTFAFTNEKGNKLLFSGCSGYSPIGNIDLEDECIVFWTNNTNSYIQTFKLDSKGNISDNYILFDDISDQNNDKLHFSTAHYIQGRGEIENEDIRRIYFWDNRNWNQPRVINLNKLYRTYIDHSDNDTEKRLPLHWVWDMTDPNDPQPVSQPTCGEVLEYPHGISVHAFDWNTDLVYPRIKFFRRLRDDTGNISPTIDQIWDYPVNEVCSLKTGIYQYFVRYITYDDYKTPISPITDHIFLTSKYKNALNHHLYEMYANNVVTQFGIELKVQGVDTRYPFMEIGYIYSIQKEEPHEVTIFKRIALQKGQENINVQHINHSGIPVNKDDITVRYETIMGINTAGVKDNTFFLGGINTLPNITFNVDSITIKPHIRLMHGDEGNDLGTSVDFEPIMAENYFYTGQPDPATNSRIRNETVTISNFAGSTEPYDIFFDYANYKGMQWENLFKGYWKGEVYGIGVVALDRKGNPLFVQHFDDYKFPEMYESGVNIHDPSSPQTAYSHTRYNSTTNEYELKIMGLMISGIKIPKDIMFDKFGKLNISGFKIVRNLRAPRILHQGILLNCTYEKNCKEDKDPDDESEITRPLPGWTNKFTPTFKDQSSNLYHNKGRCAKRINRCKKPKYLDILNRPHTFTYECPDLFVSQETLEDRDSDYIKLVGTVHKGYSTPNIELFGGHAHFYTKNYLTNSQENRYAIGSESRLHDVWKLYSREQRKPYDKDSPNLAFTNDIWGIYIDTEGSPINSQDLLVFPTKDCPPIPPNTPKIDCFPMTGIIGKYYLAQDTGLIYAWDGAMYVEFTPTEDDWSEALYASGHKDTTVIKCRDFMHLDITQSGEADASYHLVNYLRPNTDYYSDNSESSLETRQYISTNHYQPITENVLAAAKKVLKDGTIIAGNVAIANEDTIEYYQFDDIEVWGGDCFLQYVDFTRLLPYYKGACETCQGGILKDYAVSHIIPLECNNNLMMRYGRHFAKNSSQPEATPCNNEELWYRGGIMDRQPEDWNVNEVLQHQNNLQYYSSRPVDVKIIDKFPARVYYSLNKTYGELEDRYRKILRLNFHDLEGIHGEITGFAEAFNQIYCLQTNGYGILRVYERAVIPTDIDAPLSIGNGLAISGIQYISTVYGCQHRESIVKMNNAVYWIDVRMGRFIRFAQDGNTLISENSNAHDLAVLTLPSFEKTQNTKNIKVLSAHDYLDNEIVFTLHNSEDAEAPVYTIIFNEILNKFISFYSFIPKTYITHKSFVLSSDPEKEEDVYIHKKGKRGQFYGKYFKTILHFIVNETPNVAKVFDNQIINVNIEGHKRIDKATYTTQNQTHILDLYTDTRKVYREDALKYPIREDVYHTDRVRGHLVDIILEIDNAQQEIDNEDIDVNITNIDTDYRVSHRI